MPKYKRGKPVEDLEGELGYLFMKYGGAAEMAAKLKELEKELSEIKATENN